MTDHPDVELTARYPLADTTTAADLAELLLTVPADARIGFTVPIRAVQSYADVAPPQQPRTMTATWTVPAGQPLTPPNTADEAPGAGWGVQVTLPDGFLPDSMERVMAEARSSDALAATGYDLTGPEANFAAHEARRRAAAAQVPAVGSTMRGRLADPLAMGGTGL